MSISLLPTIVSLQANISGGWTPYHLLSANTTNATNVKSSPGSVGYIAVFNTTSTVFYFKLFDKASAPTLGTDVPIHSFPVPSSSTGAGFVLPIPAGINFVNGISFALTANQADNDTTAAATGVTIDLGYV